MGVSAGKDCNPASAIVVERSDPLRMGSLVFLKLTTASSGVRRHQHKQ
jgi:hypothetical protein